MESFPVVRDPGSIELLLKHIRNSIVPGKADEAYMREQGFRREGDNALNDLLVFLGFVSDDCIPSDLWHTYRDDPAVGSRILASAIRSSYDRLFQACPLALDLGVADVVPHLRQLTGAPDTELTLMYYTFRVLCDLAEPAIRDRNLPKLSVKQAAPGPKPAAGPVPAKSCDQGARTESAGPAPAPPRAEARPSTVQEAAARAEVKTVGVSKDSSGGLRITITLELDASSDPALADLAKRLAARAMAAELQRGNSI